ncbi:NUDIX domain-containing protein [Streptomyces sp. NPDC091272]|uniref:NUDIX domain-containing protein n=1 Tax=Streptomyces sp. NPDC091272 TaxID=3365981 RepID=UPI0037FB8FCF
MSDGYQPLAADVVQIPLRENGTALCVPRRPGTDRAPGQFALIGGGPLLSAEPLDHAARREAQEQAGVRISARNQEFVGLLHQHVPERADRVTVVFTQTWPADPHSAKLHEQQELFWVPIVNPPANCDADTAAAFQLLTEGLSHQAPNWPSTGGTS